MGICGGWWPRLKKGDDMREGIGTRIWIAVGVCATFLLSGCERIRVDLMERVDEVAREDRGTWDKPENIGGNWISTGVDGGRKQWLLQQEGAQVTGRRKQAQFPGRDTLIQGRYDHSTGVLRLVPQLCVQYVPMVAGSGDAGRSSEIRCHWDDTSPFYFKFTTSGLMLDVTNYQSDPPGILEGSPDNFVSEKAYNGRKYERQ